MDLRKKQGVLWYNVGKGQAIAERQIETLICLDVEAIPWGIGEKEEANDLLLEIPRSICERRNFVKNLDRKQQQTRSLIVAKQHLGCFWRKKSRKRRV